MSSGAPESYQDSVDSTENKYWSSYELLKVWSPPRWF